MNWPKGPFSSALALASQTENTALCQDAWSFRETREKLPRHDHLGLDCWARPRSSKVTAEGIKVTSHQSNKCVSTARSAEPMIRAAAEIHRDSWVHTTILHDPKCRLDYPLALIRLHHANFQPRLLLQELCL
ncbi:hypothetical protein ACE6H2_016374 [Prunus campanulata]